MAQQKNNIDIKSIGLIIAGIIFLAFIYNKSFSPFLTKWSEQSRAIKSKKEIIKKSETLIKEKGILEERFKQLTQKMETQLPVEREESQFLTEISSVAKETDIHIATMNPLQIKEVGSFKELSVEIEMEANLGNLARFLYLMRKSSVVLVANKLRMEPKSERSALLKGYLVISTIFPKNK